MSMNTKSLPEWLETATFEEMVEAKIGLRKAGQKGGIRYSNIEAAMKRRFGRT